LTALANRDQLDLSKYNQRLLQFEAFDNAKLYGLPMSVHAEAPAMVYNRDLFQKAGVAEPPTQWGDASWGWDTFVEAARKLTVATPDGSALTQAGVETLAYSVHIPVLWEGNWVSSQLNQATCDAQPMLDAYTSYADLILKYKGMPGPKLKLASGSFKGGQAAMSTMGSWEFGVYQTLHTINWGFMPFPKATRSAYAFDPNMEYIARSSKHIEETWTFLKWLDEGSRYALFFNFMPMINADTATWVKTFFQGQPNARPDVLTQSLLNAQPIDPMFRVKGSDAFIRQNVEPALADINAGKTEVTATLQKIKPLLQQLIAQAAT
jgi:multiple sugar transport system substrate-binding protein